MKRIKSIILLIVIVSSLMMGIVSCTQQRELSYGAYKSDDGFVTLEVNLDGSFEFYDVLTAARPVKGTYTVDNAKLLLLTSKSEEYEFKISDKKLTFKKTNTMYSVFKKKMTFDLIEP